MSVTMDYESNSELRAYPSNKRTAGSRSGTKRVLCGVVENLPQMHLHKGTYLRYSPLTTSFSA